MGTESEGGPKAVDIDYMINEIKKCAWWCKDYYRDNWDRLRKAISQCMWAQGNIEKGNYDLAKKQLGQAEANLRECKSEGLDMECALMRIFNLGGSLAGELEGANDV